MFFHHNTGKMIILENEHIIARINPLGAELQSLRHKANGIEYMWQGNPAFWGKHSPVLFPVVGSLKDNTYYVNDKAYLLPRHGFARERVFSCEKTSDHSAVFTLTEDNESLQAYPFAFRLQLVYDLQDDSLRVTYAVHNPAAETLWFSVGGHPAFNVPLLSGTTYQNHYLQFEKDEPLVRWHLQDGLISEHSSAVSATKGRVFLSPALFYEDAIVLKHLKSRHVTLGSTRHAHGLDFDFSGFPYLGIWAAKDAPFVCIEPWCGHADTVSHDGMLENKPGIERLESGENWERTWAVTVF